MSDQIKTLIEILTAEQSLYEDILQKIREENEALLSMDSDALLAVTKTKDTLVLRLKALEESRETVTKQIADAAGLSYDTIDLRTIVSLFPGETGTVLESLRSIISSLVTQCRSENERNKKVLSTGAKVLSDALHFFHQALSSPPVYEETKKVRVKSTSGAVLSRQA